MLSANQAQGVQTLTSLLSNLREAKAQEIIEHYGTMLAVFQNIDALPLTSKQKESLKAVRTVRFIRDESALNISTPSMVLDACFDLQTETQEHMVILLLDTRNNLIGRVNLYKGTVSESRVRVSEVFREAIIRNSPNIIVVHNHPSGNPKPSPDDISITSVIAEAGKLLDIHVVDHVIIGAGTYISLRELGVGGLK